MGRKGAAAKKRDLSCFGETYGMTLVFSGLMTGATGGFLLAAPFLPDPGDVRADWLGLGFLIGGLFIANMARMVAIWGALGPAVSTPPNQRQASAQATIQKGFGELFLWLILSMLALTALAFASTAEGALPWEVGLISAEESDRSPLPMVVFLGTLALAFLPLLMGTWLQARTELGHRKDAKGKPARLFRNDAVSPASFYIGILLIGGIGALANWAAGAADTGSAISGALSMWITFIVISIFVFFIFVPHVGRFFTNQRERREANGKTVAAGVMPLEAPARLASWIDSALVRLVAPLSGATQAGVPHLLVILILLPLTALGFVLAAPWGLVPIALGMLLVAALGRRWAWVEEDRETASRLLKTDGPEIQIGFDNDLKDEALLGYAFLFILVPLSLHQLWGWQTDAFEATDGADVSNAFFAWLSFFGAELAKAVPFVDWWEIYQVDLKRPIEPSETSALGKHLTFLSRAMVDLVIMAALFQAIGIWQRSRTQKRLYEAGQIDAFDPFLEEQFFRDGMQRTRNGFRPTPQFEERVQNHVERKPSLGLPPIPYNERRLTDLLEHPDEEISSGANWMVTMFDVLVGKPSRKLELLADRWDGSWEAEARPDGKMMRVFAHINPEWRRQQKPRIESVLEELLGTDRETSPKSLSDIDILNLMRLLKHCGNYSEFYYVRIEIIELLAQATTPSAFWALVAQSCPANEVKFGRWIQEVKHRFGATVETDKGTYAPPYFAIQNERALCYQAIAEHALGYDEGDMPTEVCEYLDLMRGMEATTYARPAAQAAFQRLGCSGTDRAGPAAAPEAEIAGIPEDEEEDVGA